MTRWWADPDQSRVVLGLVDDSDVEQGVGTALLAYHGLATRVLEPLAQRTLVDVSMIRSSLDAIDLEPVAKALGRATKPIMGDASERYGQLMASDMHRQAVDATERLLLHLTGTGMAWPVAIERAATVHGVPLERVGKAATELGKPALPPTVRQDVGDRALMEYAAHLGYRETGAVVEIGKASEEEWDEAEHPRGAGGRFVNAPDRLEPATALQARLDRFRRKKRGQARIQAHARRQQAAPQGTNLADLVAAMREHVNAAEEKEQPRALQEAKAPKSSLKEKRRALRLVKNPRRQGQDDDLSKPLPHSGLEYKIGGERFALVPTEMAQQLKGMDEFSLGRLEQAMGTPLEWMDHDTITEHVRDVYQASSMPAEALGYTVLYIDGNIPVRDGSRHDPSVYMTPSVQLEPLGRNTPKGFDALEAVHEFDDLAVKVPPNMMHPNPAMRSVEMTRQLPIMRVRAANENEYGSIHEPAQSKKYGNPMGYEYDDFDKADYWNENEVRRDARGRFADEPDRLEPERAFAARQDRFKRKKRGQARIAAVRRKAVQAPAPKLSAEDMAVLRDMIEQDLAAEDTLAAPVKKPAPKRSLLKEKRRAMRRQHVASKLSVGQSESGVEGAKDGSLEGMVSVLVDPADLDVVFGRGSDQVSGELGQDTMFNTSLRQQALGRVREAYKAANAVGMVRDLTVKTSLSDPHTVLIDATPMNTKAGAEHQAQVMLAQADHILKGALELDDVEQRYGPDAAQTVYELTEAMTTMDYPKKPAVKALPSDTKDGVMWQAVATFGKGREQDKVMLTGFESDFARLLSDEIPQRAPEPFEALASELLHVSGDDSVPERDPLLRVIPLDYGHTKQKD